MFTRQLSILQDAGLPILRSLRILENQATGGRFKNSLMDVCDEIEGGATLSEAMAKSPKCFNRLYVNMIKAGEAGGALEIILRRLAEFQERAQTLKRKIKGAMVYPIVVISVAVGILTFIMIKIVPSFVKIFEDFDTALPAMTIVLINISNAAVAYWYLIPGIPIGLWLFIKMLRKFKAGRVGWDMFMLKMPVFGPLVEKNILARTTRTLGTLVSSGVPILEALNITRETAGNATFEFMFTKVIESIREGESIAKPMKEFSKMTLSSDGRVFLVLLLRRPDRAAVVPRPDEIPRRRRPDRQHGRRGRRDRRARYDALQGRRYVRRGSVGADRKSGQPDGATVDHFPGRGSRFHCHRAIHAAGQAHHRLELK